MGSEYTKERIKERIEEKALAKDKKRVPFPIRKKPIVRDYSKKNLIDTRNLDVEKLRNDYNALYSRKETLRKTCQSAEKDAAALTRKPDSLNQYFGHTPAEQDATNRKPDKNQQLL